jgi:phosphopantothenoylcysteine synthetase/decarboxylase
VNFLVTAGNTQAPIDRVRCLTNIFTGRTGTRIALHALERGHTVTLLTSHPEVVEALQPAGSLPRERWSVYPYRTFDDLHDCMEQTIRQGHLDVVVHSAAVSDYLAVGTYAPAEGTRFREEEGTWESPPGTPDRLVNVTAAKVKSDAPELWLRLVRAPKLVDLVRPVWGFRGVLVKFKLEVGVSKEELLAIAERSRRHSGADLMVANTLEGIRAWAYLGPLGTGSKKGSDPLNAKGSDPFSGPVLAGRYRRLSRTEMPVRLLDAVERLHEEKAHG